MKQSSTRFLNMLLSLLLLVASIFVYGLLLSPAYSEVNELRGDLSAKAESVREQTLIVEKVKQLINDYRGLSAPRRDIVLVLPTKPEYPTLINQLSNLAKASGLALDSIALSKAPAASEIKGADLPPVSELQATLALKGPYQAMKSFLDKIETNIRLMDVVRMSLAPGVPGSGTDNFSYNLVVSAYYQTLF